MTRRLLSAGLVAAALLSRAFAEPVITVSLDSPDPFKPAYGAVEVRAVVVAEEEIERVAFYVDGTVVGEVSGPPYRLRVDLGDDVAAHRFEVVAYGVTGATGTGRLTTPPLRIDDEVAVHLQQLYVTVSRAGERLLDLTAEEFEILDERRSQKLVTFARGDVPFTALVLLDASTSMAGAKLAAALRGAAAFFDGMRPLDEGKLLVFSDRILHATPFTTFPDVLSAGLGRVEARGGTAINDHLYLALKQLEERQGRRVVLLLSDGVDSHSVLPTADVAAVARRSQALIYWLRLPYGGGAAGGDLPALTTAWRSADDYRREFDLLGRTVEESGGRIHLLGSADEIVPAFQGILAELRDQYVLGYYPLVPRHDGSWRQVRVRVRRRGVEVRSRGGYFDL